MISLREAFHLCNVRDDEVIFLREEGSPRYYNTPFTGKEIRNKYDMRKVSAVHIRPALDFGEYVGMEFEVRYEKRT